MVLEFYYDNLSQPCRAVYLFLKGSGVDFESKPVDLLKGEQKQPEFKKKNPFGKVPLIVDDGFVLSESVAIMRYVATKYSLPEYWFPRKDVQQVAKIDEFMNWQHLCIRKPAAEIFLETFRSRIGVGRYTKKPRDEEKVSAAKEELKKALEHIAEYFLQDKPYICGDDISAADILGVCELIHLGGVNENEIYEKNAKVKEWIQRIGDRLAPHFEEANFKLKGLNKMFNDAEPVNEETADERL